MVLEDCPNLLVRYHTVFSVSPEFVAINKQPVYDTASSVGKFDYGESIGVVGRQHLRCLGMCGVRVDRTWSQRIRQTSA
jgi:hypothetical protein